MLKYNVVPGSINPLPDNKISDWSKLKQIAAVFILGFGTIGGICPHALKKMWGIFKGNKIDDLSQRLFFFH